MKHKRNKVKKLSIHTLYAIINEAELIEEFKEEKRPEIAPIFNINGVYKTKDKTWVELEGKAFLINADNMFDYYVKSLTYEERRLRKSELDCLIKLHKINPKLVIGKNREDMEREIYLRNNRCSKFETFKIFKEIDAEILQRKDN